MPKICRHTGKVTLLSWSKELQEKKTSLFLWPSCILHGVLPQVLGALCLPRVEIHSCVSLHSTGEELPERSLMSWEGRAAQHTAVGPSNPPALLLNPLSL